MALVLPNSVFFHLPKTGGTFIRKTIQDLGIANEQIGDVHIDPVQFLSDYPDQASGRYTFTFIRHPLNWWQSYWQHRIRTGWSGDHPMDLECRHSDFSRYMEQVLSSGWKYHYLDTCEKFLSQQIDFIGRQENLVEDLNIALRHAEEKYDVLSVGRLGRINASASEKAIYPRQTRNKVISIHSEFIQTHYRSTHTIARRFYAFKGWRGRKV